MHIVIHDYSGHPFQVQLSRELSQRGHRVRHQYCTSYATGKGALTRRADDSESFSIEPLSMASEFARYSPVKRTLQEIRYGLLLGKTLRSDPPDLVVMCNIPLIAHAIAAFMVRAARIPMVFWQQDVYSSAIGSTARRRLGKVVGGAIAWIADRTERAIARRSSHIVAISDTFLDVLDRWGIPRSKISVIPNWAALPEMPTRPRINDWARSHDLLDRPTIFYSGTLGLKHNPRIFLQIAERLRTTDPQARVVVVSQGAGRELLEAERERLGLSNLILLDYQPYESLPEVLATADVLVAILEPDASQFSVPSKVLNYLCAARPILGVMPPGNGAAVTLTSTGAGVLADPASEDDAAAIVSRLFAQPELRAKMGAAGRAYAEETFDVGQIGSRFETALSAVLQRQADPTSDEETPHSKVLEGMHR